MTWNPQQIEKTAITGWKNCATYYSGKWYVALVSSDKKTFSIYSSPDGTTWNYETGTTPPIGTNEVLGNYSFHIDEDGYAYLLWRTGIQSPGYRWLRTTRPIYEYWEFDTVRTDGCFANNTNHFDKPVITSLKIGTTTYLHFFMSRFNGTYYLAKHNYSTDQGTTWIDEQDIYDSSNNHSYTIDTENSSDDKVWILYKNSWYDPDLLAYVNDICFRAWDYNNPDPASKWGEKIRIPNPGKHSSDYMAIDSQDNLVLYYLDYISDEILFTWGKNEQDLQNNKETVGYIGSNLYSVGTFMLSGDRPVACYQIKEPYGSYYDYSKWYSARKTESGYVYNILEYDFSQQRSFSMGKANERLFIRTDSVNANPSVTYDYAYFVEMVDYADAISHLPPAGGGRKVNKISFKGLHTNSKIRIGGLR